MTLNLPPIPEEPPPFHYYDPHDPRAQHERVRVVQMAVGGMAAGLVLVGAVYNHTALFPDEPGRRGVPSSSPEPTVSAPAYDSPHTPLVELPPAALPAGMPESPRSTVPPTTLEAPVTTVPVSTSEASPTPPLVPDKPVEEPSPPSAEPAPAPSTSEPPAPEPAPSPEPAPEPVPEPTEPGPLQPQP